MFLKEEKKKQASRFFRKQSVLSFFVVFLLLAIAFPALASDGLMNGKTITGETDNFLFWLQTYDQNTSPYFFDRFFIDKLGNVGIGTTGPSYPLHLYKASSETGILTSWGGSNVYLSHGGWGIGAGKFGIGNSTSPLIVADTNTGNVGIGTTTPSVKLDVNGGINATGLCIKGDCKVSWDAAGALWSGTRNGNIWNGDAGAGNVGIGDSAPGHKLAVTGDIAGSTALGINGSTASDWLAGNVGIGIGSIGASKLSVWGNQSIGKTYFSYPAPADGLIVEGSVGIGTTNPTAKLDIVGGNIDIDNTTFANQFGVISKNGVRFIHDFNYGNNGTVTTAGNNVFIGYNSGNFTMGSTATQTYQASYNTAVGRSTLPANTTGYQNSAFGNQSLYNNNTGYANSAFGYQSLYGNISGGNNSALGQQALENNTVGNNNSAVGYYSLNSSVAGSNGVAIGQESQRFTNNTSTSWTNSNTSVGYQSLRGSTTAANNTGNYNSAFGYVALQNNTTGNNNTAVGYQSLLNNTSGSSNNAFGYNTLVNNTSGNNNTGFGHAALFGLSSGSDNTALGFNAGRFIANGSTSNITSSNSTYLGASTKALADNDTNETVIGYNATGIGSNTVTIGNTNVSTTTIRGSVGIGTSTPNATLQVNGNTITTGLAFSSNPSDVKISWSDIVSAGGGNQWITSGTNIYNANYNTGNVGIGSSAPATDKLSVVGNISGDSALKISGSAASDWLAGNVGIGIGSIGASKLSVWGNQSIGKTYFSYPAPADGLIVEGSVGIGTTAPSQKLEVNGNILATGSSFDNQNQGVVIAKSVIPIGQWREVAQGASVTTTGGTLNNGGPTARNGKGRWDATATGQSITLYMPGSWWTRAISFTSGYIYETSYLNNKLPASFLVEKSTDGSTWTTVADVTNNTSWYFYSSSLSDAPYIRITVRAFQGTATAASIANIQVFDGTSAGTTGPFSFNGAGNAVFMGGNVGIGTISPLTKLSVVGASQASAGSTNGIFSLTTGTGATTDESIQMGIVDGSYGWIQPIKPGTSYRNLVLVPQGGSVGIGTTSPQNILEVYKDTNSGSYGVYPSITLNNPNSSGYSSFILANGTGAANIVGRIQKNVDNTVTIGTYVNKDLILETNRSEVMRLQASGNVGIGTTTPSVKLDVNGGINATGLCIKGDCKVSWDAAGALWSGTRNGNIWNGDAGAGNVGIGDSNPGHKLAVVGDITGSISLGISSTTADNWIGGKLGVGIGSAGSSKLSVWGNQSIGQTYLNYPAPTNGLIVEGSVGIGTTNPTSKLDVVGGNIDVDNTTFANQNGVITKNGIRFIHDFNYGNNGTVTTDGNNTFVGRSSGNFTMGSTATAATHSSYNVGLGSYTLYLNTTGYSNAALGTGALQNNTTGSTNSAAGMQPLYYNISGSQNTANGAYALYSNVAGNNGVAVGFQSQYYVNNTATTWTNYNTSVGYQALRGSVTQANNTGNSNTAVGYVALFNNSTGANNSAFGQNALYNNTTGNNNVAIGLNSLYAANGSQNIAIGQSAGRYIADGSTANSSPNNSIYLGYNAKAYANGDTNETVIGYNATGIGSNTVTIGNSNVATTTIYGSVGIGTTTPNATLQVNGTINAAGLCIGGVCKVSWDAAGALWSGSRNGNIWNGDAGAGNVGVGTTAPGAKLHVYNNIDGVFNGLAIDNRKTYGAGTGINETSRLDLSLSEGGAPDPLSRVFGYMEAGTQSETSSADGWMAFGTRTGGSATEKLRINAAGNVGIGDTNPPAKLSVVGDIAGSVSLGISSSTASNWISGNVGIGIGSKGSSKLSVWGNQSIGQTYLSYPAPTNGLIVEGNVGVGTTNPGSLFEIRSNTNARFTINRTGNWAASPADIKFSANDAGTDSWTLGMQANSTNNFYLNKNASNYLTVLESSGNVGIGTTNPVAKLHVNGNIYLSSTNPYGGINYFNAQKEQNVAGTAVVTGAGWYRIAHMDGSNGRGQNTVTVYTTGGSYVPRSTTIRWFHDWGTSSGINAISEMGSSYWNQARVTNDGTNSFLEVYFTQAITVYLSMQYDGGYVNGLLYDGTLTSGGGSVETTIPLGLFSVGNKLLVDTSGNVGIGTTTPAFKLDVNGKVNATDLCIKGDCKAAWSDIVSAGGGNQWTTSGNNIYNSNSGSVGIGTTTPAAKLDVYGSAFFGTTNRLKLQDFDSNSFSVQATLATDDSAKKNLIFNGWGGFVGIGDTNPADKLTVTGNIAGKGLEITSTDTLFVTGKNFTVGNSGGGGSQLSVFNNAAIGTSYYGYAAPANGLIVQGNVGIGTSNPNKPLMVVGSNNSESPAFPKILSVADSSDATKSISLGYSSSWDAGVIQSIDDGTTWKNTVINPNGGNVGIGTTNPGAYRLNVSGNTYLNGTLTASGAATFNGGVTMGAVLNLAGYDIQNVNKISANVVDPLYNIKGVNYSTFASAIAGGLKEEYVGRVAASDFTKKDGYYEKTIDLAKEKSGSDLWVWYHVIEFNDKNVEVFLTPRNGFASTYSLISGSKIIIRSDRPADLSMRLVGSRFDWRKWPTKPLDQTEKSSLIIK